MPSFTIISNRCAHLGCPVQANGPTGAILGMKNVDRAHEERQGHARARSCPPASAARATAASTTPRATAPPARRCARSTATTSRSRTAASILLSTYSVSQVDGTGAQAKIHKYKLVGPGEHVDGVEQVLLSPQPAAPLMASRRQPSRAEHPQAADAAGDQLSRSTGSRSGRGSSAASSTSSSATSPPTSNWMQTLGSATLTAFLVQAITGVILAMYYKPTPNDAYSSIQNITDHVTLGWLVRGMHKLGRERLHHPHVPAHGPRVPVRRVQVPARAELDRRRAAARAWA